MFYFSPSACLEHDPNPGHPECPQRLDAIEQALARSPLAFIERREAAAANRADLLLAHDPAYVDFLFRQVPTTGLNFLDPDTALSPRSGDAALAAAGAVLGAVAAVTGGETKRAFCTVRPPGHHAHRAHGAGFCLFNNVAIGALVALQRHGVHRVAILDFDVHHGDGTQDIVADNPAVFFASTYQDRLYSADGDTAAQTDRLVNIPFAAGTGGAEILAAWRNIILPRMAVFGPDLILVSAGFDAHRDDPLGGLDMTANDFGDLMRAIRDLADMHCGGRLVAVLEGGYDLPALGASVVACLQAMAD